MENSKKVHVVLAHSTTGSGSLTFPEDFEFLGAYEDRDDARRCALEFNLSALENFVGDVGDMTEDDITDSLRECDGALVAKVVCTDLYTRKHV